jgi:hypothetical protein
MLAGALSTLQKHSTDSPFVLIISGPVAHGIWPDTDLFARAPMSMENVQKVILTCISRGMAEDIHLKTELFTVKQTFTKSFTIGTDQLELVLLTMLNLPFRQAHLQTPAGDLYCRSAGKKGREHLLFRSAPASRRDWPQKHDESRNYPITPLNAAPLLSALGMLDEQHRIIPAMQAKYKQINHFILLAANSSLLDQEQNKGPVHVIDCGCGKAYLSFALLYWLLIICRREGSRLSGIEANPNLVEFCASTAQKLHFQDCARFYCSYINSWHDAPPPQKDIPELLIALHACDTATDDALALGIQRGVQSIMAAPCCHHFVQKSMQGKNAPASFQFLLRDGIIRERMGDMLTDTMRRDMLGACGYSASLIEFTPLEHTAKNIMIRADFVPSMPASHKNAALERFISARNEWNVYPKLAEIIGDTYLHTKS